MAKATRVVCSPIPSSSKPIETANTIMMVRMVEAISRGDGRSALTAASSAAREKKLAPSSPKKNTNRAANSRGKNPKKRATCRSEEHTSELQSQSNLVCRLLLEKKKIRTHR